MILDHETHKYYNLEGIEYLSVSKLLSKLKGDFDSEGISLSMARKQVSDPKDYHSIGERQAEILKEWKDINKKSTDHGTRIHNALEDYANTGDTKEEDLKSLCVAIQSLFNPYYRTEQEKILHLDKAKLAGTADKICYRSRSSGSTIDIWDYKTNIKGIKYDDKYGKFMLDPVSHLEDASFNHYALQMSIYGYFLKEQFGRKIGKLGIIFIPPENHLNFQIIPVPFMYAEARDIVNWYIKQSTSVVCNQDFMSFEEL